MRTRLMILLLAMVFLPTNQIMASQPLPLATLPVTRSARLDLLGSLAAQPAVPPLLGVTISDHFAFVSSADQVRVLDVSDPRNPRLHSTLFLKPKPTGGDPLIKQTLIDQQLVIVYTDYQTFRGACPRNMLITIDVSNIDQLRQVGTEYNESCWLYTRSGAAGRWFYEVLREEQELTVVNTQLQLFDPAGATGPTLLATVPLHTPESLAVLSETLYLGTKQGLEIVQASDPAQLVTLGTLATDQPVYAVAAEDGLAYLVTAASRSGEAWLRLVDVRDPTQPTLLTSLRLPNGLASISVDAGRVALHNTAGMQLVDARTPTRLSLRSSPDLSAIGLVQQVQLAGNLAFVTGQNGLIILDISDPAHPQPRSLLNGAVTSVASAENSLIGVVIGGMLELRNTSGVLVSRFDPQPPLTMASNIFIYGNLAFIHEGLRYNFDSTSIIQVSNPQQPRFVGRYPKRIMQVRGSIGYAQHSYTENSLINLRDPALPSQQEKSVINSANDSLAPPVGTQLYLSSSDYDHNRTTLSTFDLSNPEQPVLRSTVELSGSLAYRSKSPRMLLAGQRLLIPLSKSEGSDYERDGFVILDQSDPDRPRVLGTFNTSSINSQGAFVSAWAATPDFLYQFIRENNITRLEIIDIRNPSAPQLVKTIPVTIGVDQIAIAGRLGFMTESEYSTGVSLQVFDLSDPLSPTLLSEFDTIGTIHEIDVVGNLLYVVDQASLRIYRVSTPITAQIPPDGGVVQSSLDNTSYTFAAGTFSITTHLTHLPVATEQLPAFGELSAIGHSFALTLTTKAQLAETDLELVQAAQQFSVTVGYTAQELGSVRPTTLALYRWNGVNWIKEPSSVVDTSARTLSATVVKPGLFAILGEAKRILLPVALR